MSLARRSLCTTLLAVALLALLAAAAQAASASTFFVNQTTGVDTNPCSEAAPCKTIGKAIEVAAAAPEAPTIEVGPGTYSESEGALNVQSTGDEGLTIVGAGSGATVIEGFAKDKDPVIELGIDGGHAKLAALTVLAPEEDEAAGIESEESLVLQNVAVVMDSALDTNAIEQAGIAALLGEGLQVTMEGGSEGTAIVADDGPVTLSGSTITVAPGSTASGIEDSVGALTIGGSIFSLDGTASGAAIDDDFGALALTSDTIDQGGISSGAIFADAPVSASYSQVSIAMVDHESEHPAVQQNHGGASFANVTIEGAWKGAAISSFGSAFSLVDSHLTGGPEGKSPVLFYAGNTEGPGWLIQRSTIAASQLDPAAVQVLNGNMTLDSATVLGGVRALEFTNSGPRPKALTVAASTVDAGVVGAADEKDHDVALKAEHGAITAANVVGSILVEPQKADGEGSAIACAYTDVPNQAQAASATLGAIGCATGLNGNTSTPPASLFAAPTLSIGPAPGSAAIDSVPAGAIVLPFGFASSATDLLGEPRDVDGNGDCIAVQDRGAVELQGHAAPCPPVLGALTNLKLSPGAFHAAPSGAAVAKAVKFGTTISYGDSQVAVTTFTVVAHETGRRQGRSCKKPSKHNRKHKPCVRVVVLGSFTHKDVAGANSLRFTGRFKGHKLAKRGYLLQAVPRDAAGAGATVERSFTIK
ncbi:MAG TPA: DUF1565 domain-containing protein [Solirubrobacteraceae bacterium]|jgi:hypothetical protein